VRFEPFEHLPDDHHLLGRVFFGASAAKVTFDIGVSSNGLWGKLLFVFLRQTAQTAISIILSFAVIAMPLTSTDRQPSTAS
jgi:hypothetical protein